MKLASVVGTITKSYLYTRLAKDAARFVRDNLSDIEFDRDYWLHRAGLARYTPVRGAFAGLGLLGLGAVIGGVVALAITPKNGEQLRSDLRERAAGLLNRVERTTRDVRASA